MSRQLQISRTRESTFKLQEHLLTESSQISLQFTLLLSEISNLVSQGLLVLLQLLNLLVGLSTSSL